jgi:hypothetical protein
MIERARIISIVCHPRGRNQCPLPQVQGHFPDSVPSQLVLTQGLNQEPLRFPLQLFYCDTSLKRGSPVNKAVRRITSGKTQKQWSVTCPLRIRYIRLTEAGADPLLSSNMPVPVD